MITLKDILIYYFAENMISNRPLQLIKKKGSLKAHHKLFPFNVDIKKIDRCISFLNEKMKLEKVKNYWGNGDGQGEFSSLKCSLSTIDEAGSRLC